MSKTQPKIKTIKIENTEYNLAVKDLDLVVLSEDLYTYTPIGLAQNATNKVIGSGNPISNKNPGKIGIANESTLKDVFNTIFGVQQDEEPTVGSPSLSVSQTGNTLAPSSEQEIGKSVAEEACSVTFTLNNVVNCSFGYNVNGTNTTGSQSIQYPITKINSSDIEITLPSSWTSAKITSVSGGTLNKSNGNKLYYNFNSGSKAITLNFKLDATTTTASKVTRCAAITGKVNLGSAKTTSGAAITNFLTLKGNASTKSTNGPSDGISDSSSKYETRAGYIPYAWELATAAVSANGNLPTTHKQKSAYTNISITDADGSKNLYIYVPSSNTIEAITNNTYSAPFTSDGTRTLKVNGKDATFNIYHVIAKVAPGTNKYVITYN